MNWFSPLVATLVLMIVSIVISTAIGFVAAWALRMSQSAGWFVRRFVAPICLLACVAAVISPLILHAAAWEATAGKFGITMLTQTGTRATSGDRYSLFAGGLATSWIHGMHGAAIVAIATFVGTRRTPASLVDSGKLRMGPSQRFWRVDLPLASPWFGSAIVIVAILAVTEMTVADLYGYRTIADQFYLYYAADPNLKSVFAVCFGPLAIAMGLILFVAICKRRFVRLPAHRDPYPVSGGEAVNGVTRFTSVAVMVLVAILVVGIPVFGIVNKLGQTVSLVGEDLASHWSVSVAASRLAEAPTWFAAEYRWTALIGITSAIVSILIALPLASVANCRHQFRTFADIATVVLVCVPGPVTGLAVYSLFQLPVPGFRFLMQQTIFPTVLACLARSLPIAYWVMRAGYASVANKVLDAARMRLGWWQQLAKVEVPMMKPWIAIAILASAVFASGDLPATGPVIPAGITTVPVRLFGLLHSGARYQEAALAFWYLAGLMLISVVVLRISRLLASRG